MFNLIKYDFVRKYKYILIGLIATIVLNLFSCFKAGPSGGIFIMILFPIITVVLYIVDIIKMYSDDVNKKSGYMLFMTSHSGYEILISKVITALLEGLFIILFYFIIIFANSTYLSFYNDGTFNFNIRDMVYVINSLLSGSFGINLGHILTLMLSGVLSTMSFIISAYTAITIRKSIFSEVKLGGLLSFIIFICLNWLQAFIFEKVSFGFEFILGSTTTSELFMALLPSTLALLAICVVLTAVSGYLLENKINL